MINLLSDEKKREIKAGRANTIILSYVFMALTGIALLGILSGGVYLTLNVTRSEAQRRVSANQSDIAKYQSVQDQASTFRNNLTTAKQILDKEVVYSALILKIAKAVPPGVVLGNLSLSPDSVGKPTTIKASAQSYDAAIALKTSFQNQPDLFTDVHFNDISSQGSTPTNPYPISVTLALTINKAALQQ